MRTAWSWAPALVLAAGAALNTGARQQPSLELRAPLADAVPASLAGASGQDVSLSDREVAAAGVDAYLFRTYGSAPRSAAGGAGFTVYVGYYGSQTQGRTIHSPKNCLPGSGWEALASRQERVVTAAGVIPVNRYVIRRGDERALVLYWYQGRGRVQANEYRVKLDLLRDSALRRRSDEALVRVVVPITGSEDEAFQRASDAAVELVSGVDTALPG
ncbi:MAG TPA: EpsI family protein [Longimicrobiales bacterium]|nr:EpsI family protein [Longimicrobiales bacterium]